MNPMNIAIQSSAGVFWTIAYILIMRRAARDGIYGMPIVALCANITWEGFYSFVEPPPHPDTGTWIAQVVVNATWFVFDLVLVWQAIRYWPRAFPGVPRSVFYPMFLGSLVVAGLTVVLVNRAFGDEYGVHAGLGQNVLMSALFIAMLNARRSSKGQSIGIAVSKLLGTLCAGGGAYLYPATPELGEAVLVPYLTAVVLVLDAVYLVLLWQVRRLERAGAPTPALEPSLADVPRGGTVPNTSTAEARP
ncbi:hypothetical protein SAMN05421810_101698 [Amycolatopsis arida]|uniref:Uncharacterized protein n=1 Tax=Amycolatopsis arida TaxID=587909 RepID=A0A1I5LWK9_9PSEU|nr:hypothetical protein [Amycolatopsis arida]TDX93874.1 hypothetical protein CLV69_104331 [Amycolatopsis arida]SFP01527.1 hypothetical protein SAMN05421810_101698 [Amycolatopsis arida]